MFFKNIKSFDQYYKHPMSYRFGSIYDNNGIIRIYSNGLNGDYEKNNIFYYKIKNDKIKNLFKKTKFNNITIKVVVKVTNGVEFKGKYKIRGFYKGFVRLERM